MSVIYLLFKKYKWPLDSCACLDQSNRIRNRMNQQIFLHAKNCQNWCNFIGKRKCAVSRFYPKRLYFLFNFSGSRRWTIKLQVALFSPQVSALVCAKGFIKFKQVVFANTLNNQRESNSVFSVSSYILVLRSVSAKR